MSAIIVESAFLLSPQIRFDNWSELQTIREQSLEMHAEGIMIKEKDSSYQTGRKKGAGGNGRSIR